MSGFDPRWRDLFNEIFKYLVAIGLAVLFMALVAGISFDASRRHDSLVERRYRAYLRVTQRYISFEDFKLLYPGVTWSRYGGSL